MNKKFTYFFLVIVFIFFLGSIACSKAMPRPQQNKVKELDNSGVAIPQPSSEDEQLPWENDPNFKNILAEYNNPLLMAKYKATLHDPLPGEMYNVNLAAQKLAGTIVLPGKIFSQNQKIGPYTNSKGYRSGPMYKGTKVITATGGGVCKIASLLYNLQLL